MSQKCRSKFATFITSNCSLLTANETDEKTGAPLVTRYKHHCPHATRASLQTTV